MARQPRVAPAWQNLAGLLTNRRIALDPKYRNRRVFCDERHLDYRVISDIEGARRANFSTHMLTAIEVGYELADGAIKEALANPDLTELPTNARLTDPRTNPAPADVPLPAYVAFSKLEPWVQDIWRSPHLTTQEKELSILFIRLLRGDLNDDEGLLKIYYTLGKIFERQQEQGASGTT